MESVYLRCPLVMVWYVDGMIRINAGTTDNGQMIFSTLKINPFIKGSRKGSGFVEIHDWHLPHCLAMIVRASNVLIPSCGFTGALCDSTSPWAVRSASLGRTLLEYCKDGKVRIAVKASASRNVVLLNAR